jgi:hypothetical protein
LSNYFKNTKKRKKKKDLEKKKKKKNNERTNGQAKLQMSDPARQLNHAARPGRVRPANLFPHVRVPPPRHRLQAQAPSVAQHTNVTHSQFLLFTLELIPGDLSHHLMHRLLLLKLHTVLFICPQTAQTESLQAALILPRNSTVPSR